ncbi:hypothetical protein F2Q69_00005730 [Brassica cretica]|uniref:Uncharacterized protein n=1 Tax=Brassica cretica TaxID=69181 RepID=A0A8S9NXF3_BRACR|nr:hypothetical protein F2Q69_00005730 [Brassica cretica]
MVVSSMSSLSWRDGPVADGDVALRLSMLEQRHLDTLAQMVLRATTMRWKSSCSRADMYGCLGRVGVVPLAAPDVLS